MFGVAHGLSAGYRAKGPVLTEQSAVDDLALDNCETVVVPDATADSRFQYPDEAREEGIVSVLVTPLRVQDQPIGVLRVYMPELRTSFSADERELAEAIASLSALAIENGRLYERLDRNYQAAVEFPPESTDASQRHEVAPGAWPRKRLSSPRSTGVTQVRRVFPMAVRVGINGFGRIGRQVLKAIRDLPRQRARGRGVQRHRRSQDDGAPAEVRHQLRPLRRHGRSRRTTRC